MHTDAESYQRFMGWWSRLVAPLLVDFAGVPDTGRVLDVGSGSGSLALVIAERKLRCRVEGIDLSKEYVAYANKTNPFSDRVRFQAGDAQQLPFPDAAFDASLSLLAFNFIPDADKALQEMRPYNETGSSNLSRHLGLRRGNGNASNVLGCRREHRCKGREAA